MTPADVLARFLEVLLAEGCEDIAARVERAPEVTDALSSGWLERDLAERAQCARVTRSGDRARRVDGALEASWRIGFAFHAERRAGLAAAAMWIDAASRELGDP